MAHNQIEGRPPLAAASGMAQYVPVVFLAGGSALSETVKSAASWNEFQFGITTATVASPGDPVQYAAPGETVKGIAGASLGAGCFVAVGSTNGVLAPITPSNIASVANGSGLRWAVGVALKNAAAGDYFPVFVKPDQII